MSNFQFESNGKQFNGKSLTFRQFRDAISKLREISSGRISDVPDKIVELYGMVIESPTIDSIETEFETSDIMAAIGKAISGEKVTRDEQKKSE